MIEPSCQITYWIRPNSHFYRYKQNKADLLLSDMSIGDAKSLESDLKAKESTLVPTPNLVDKVWGKERPARPSNPVFPLEEKYSGKSIKDKIARLREQIHEKKATATVITQLDEVAWTFNLRGSDIPFNPGKPSPSLDLMPLLNCTSILCICDGDELQGHVIHK